MWPMVVEAVGEDVDESLQLVDALQQVSIGAEVVAPSALVALDRSPNSSLGQAVELRASWRQQVEGEAVVLARACSNAPWTRSRRRASPLRGQALDARDLEWRLPDELVEEPLGRLRGGMSGDVSAGPFGDGISRVEPLARSRTNHSREALDRLIGPRVHEQRVDLAGSRRLPAIWFVIQHARDRFSCRACEAITQPPAPSQPIARGRAGSMLLAAFAYGKFCMYLPLHRQGRSFAREAVELDVSTMGWGRSAMP